MKSLFREKLRKVIFTTIDNISFVTPVYGVHSYPLDTTIYTDKRSNGDRRYKAFSIGFKNEAGKRVELTSLPNWQELIAKYNQHLMDSLSEFNPRSAELTDTVSTGRLGTGWAVVVVLPGQE
jgi:hypothetical protein